jgi:hypothetical protein
VDLPVGREDRGVGRGIAEQPPPGVGVLLDEGEEGVDADPNPLRRVLELAGDGAADERQQLPGLALQQGDLELALEAKWS